jgi:hypothetical protein
VQVDTIDWLRDEINRLEDAILMERDAALVYVGVIAEHICMYNGEGTCTAGYVATGMLLGQATFLQERSSC